MTLGLDFPATLAAARVGADWAWTNVYRDLAPSILRYLRAQTVDRPDDLLEEVFLEAVHSLPEFTGREDDFRAWMFTIAHQRLEEARRSERERPDMLCADQDPSLAADVADKDIDSFNGVGDAHICALMARLTPDQREVLYLRIIAGLSIEQTAQAIGKTPASIKALQIRGFQALGRQLPLLAVRP